MTGTLVECSSFEALELWRYPRVANVVKMLPPGLVDEWYLRVEEYDECVSESMATEVSECAVLYGGTGDGPES
jgi:hypothetical protein